MLSVSSSFAYNASLQTAKWAHQFLIGTSDYGSRVTQWPQINKTWNDLTPQSVIIDLSNDDKAINFLLSNPALLNTQCQLNMGFVYDVGSSEYITMFAGNIQAVQFSNNATTGTAGEGNTAGDGGGSAIAELTLIDKFNNLSTKTIGNSTSAVSFTGSSYMVHDMAWYVCTSYGGLSAITSTSNPDIDYASFGSWSSLFSADNTRLQANFTGQRPMEALQKISNLTQSAIWVENNKVKFARFNLVSSASATFDEKTVIDTLVSMDMSNVINTHSVGAAYNVTSGTFGITVSGVDSGSVNSYGTFQTQVQETVLWLTDSTSALNLVQRTLATNKNVLPNFQMTTPFNAITSTIGDILLYNDAQLGIVAEVYRCLSEMVDMDAGTKQYSMNQSQLANAFQLDVSTLDSTAILT